MVTTRARLRNAKEEREQFDEANNKILVYFKSKVFLFLISQGTEVVHSENILFIFRLFMKNLELTLAMFYLYTFFIQNFVLS